MGRGDGKLRITEVYKKENAMEDEITLKELLILFLKKFNQIIAWMLVCAILLGGFGLYKAYSAYNDADQREAQQLEYQEALKTYNDKVDLLKEEIADAKKREADLLEYNANSIYINLDCYNKAVKEIIFYVETDYQIMPGMAYQNPDKTNKIVSAYTDTYKTNDIYKGIENILGQKYEPKYISEILSVESISNANVIKIKAGYSDQAIADKMANYLFDTLKQKVTDTLGPHVVKVMSSSSFTEIDNELKENRDNRNTEMDAIGESIASKKTELEAKEKDVPAVTVASKSGIAKQSIKYAGIGAILGLVIICMWILFVHFTNNKLRDEQDVYKHYKLKLLGTIPSANGGKKNG